jgi:hypothetical protein
MPKEEKQDVSELDGINKMLHSSDGNLCCTVVNISINGHIARCNSDMSPVATVSHCSSVAFQYIIQQLMRPEHSYFFFSESK